MLRTFFIILFLLLSGCSAGTGLQPSDAGTQTGGPTYTPPVTPPGRKAFTCTVFSNPTPAVVSTYGDPATGIPSAGSSAPAVQYRISAALDGVPTAFNLIGVQLDATKVTPMAMPVEQADQSFVAAYRPLRGGTHTISFSLAARADVSYTQTCSTSLQLNLTNPSELTTNIEASSTVLANGEGAIISMSSANANDCDVYQGFTPLPRSHPLLSDFFSTGPLTNPGTMPIDLTYRSVCRNAGVLTAEDQVTVTVNPAPTAALFIGTAGTVKNTTIAQNGSVTLRWNSTYATRGCTIRDQLNNIVGNNPLPMASGTINVNTVPANRTFTLTCLDNLFTPVSDSVQVNVSAPGVNFVITSNGTVMRTGDNYQLGNTATNYTVDLQLVDIVAGSCSVTENSVNVTSQIPKTAQTSGMAASVMYSAICLSTTGGTVSAVATVLRPAIPPPNITFIDVDVDDDEELTIQWATDQPCQISIEWGKKNQGESGITQQKFYSNYTTSGSYFKNWDDTDVEARFIMRIRATNAQGMETVSAVQEFEIDD